MFSLGGTELLLIAGLALLLFGPEKLPQMARTVGKFMREFNKYKDIMESTIRTEIYAAEVKATPADAQVSEMDELAKAAQASRDFAAEQGAAAAPGAGDGTETPAGDGEAAASDAEGLAGPVDAAQAAPVRHVSVVATDEDEEEGV